MTKTIEHRRPGPRSEAGQSMVEYLVVVSALVAALFVIDVDGRTGAQHLADMVRLFYRNLTYFLSLP
ncbi:hypothetical protein KAK06_15230 [Ideonella sp. 4Y11]|uniref:Uncharacterized protein n=1 Tax=Ideonella aquatica TaxID=2824119 RepID=A0A940YLS7_9BURK|nr:hypothetical protein [Ideonella aquatica]MBQ0960306.1 hypothetical protein [Ideonella aquatica]